LLRRFAPRNDDMVSRATPAGWISASVTRQFCREQVGGLRCR
jgi:hypothetical protein